MSRQCQITGKRTRRGKSYSIRGIAKKKKGIGLNVTGTVKRRFRPNLQKKRFFFAKENRTICLKVTTSGMKTLRKLGIEEIVNTLRSQGVKV